MSALFKLSMWIRVFAYISTFFYPQYDTELFLKCFSCLLFQHGHGYLTENLGIPVWGSYAVFGLATLFLGMVLGLVSEALGTDCDCVTLVLPPPQFWAGVLGYPELGHRDGEQNETPHNPGGVRLDGIHPLDKELNSILKVFSSQNDPSVQNVWEFQLGFLCFQMMVFLADCMCPSKRHRPPQLHPQSSKPTANFSFSETGW